MARQIERDGADPRKVRQDLECLLVVGADPVLEDEGQASATHVAGGEGESADRGQR